MRDDALLLYGFATEEERDLFLLLIGVQSVGPKVALAVLSGGSPRELLAAVAAGDTARLQAVPGIGKRTAERIVVELREKVGAAPADDPIVITRGDDPRMLARDGPASASASPPRRPTSCSTAPPGETPEDLIAHALQGVAPVSDRSAPRAGEASTASRRPHAPRGGRARRLAAPAAAGRVRRPGARSRSQLAVAIRAADARGEALDHVLLAGPPGLGKTSLAQIVAAELEVDFVQTAGPALERKADIAAFLTALEPRACSSSTRSTGSRARWRRRSIPRWRTASCRSRSAPGAGARVVTLDLPPFTLIGATTRAGLLTTPLRDRFGIQHRLDHYEPGDLARIVAPLGPRARRRDRAGGRARDRRARPRHAARRQPPAQARARLRRGPRRRARSTPTPPAPRSTCSRSTTRAWTASTARSSAASARHFGGGPVGLSTLAVAVGEEADTIEDVYEPYLLQRGFLQRTPRGRCATARAFRHLGLEPPAEAGERCSEAAR